MVPQIKQLLTIGYWVTGCLFLVIGGVRWVFTNELSLSFFVESLSTAVALTGLLIVVYEQRLWKKNPWSGVPQLAAHYKGIVKSNYNGSVIRNVELDIKQTFLTVHVTCCSEESRSSSFCASLEKVSEDEFRLAYSYFNHPKIEVRKQSELHYGTAILFVEPSGVLRGQYYTDRKTAGDMELFPEPPQELAGEKMKT